MRKLILPLAAALTLGACTTSPYGSPYGSAYGGDPTLAVLGALGGVLAGGQQGYGSPYGSGYGGSGFSQAAVNACGQIASRYGQVGVRDVRQVSNSTVRVYGQVSNGYNARNWDCDFRSDGRVTDFDI